jgi:N-methylhydantoinase A
VYARGRLAPGMAFSGPAIVDQGDATCLVTPGFRARVDRAFNMHLERAHA